MAVKLNGETAAINPSSPLYRIYIKYARQSAHLIQLCNVCSSDRIPYRRIDIHGLVIIQPLSKFCVEPKIFT